MDDHLPSRSLCEQGFLVLELEGETVHDQYDLLGAIEIASGSPWFANFPGGVGLTPTYDGFDDVLGSIEEWLSVAGVVVCIWHSERLWRRMYWECGHLLKSWLFVKENDLGDLPLHLVFGMADRNGDIPGPDAERLQPYKSVQVIRWMPPGALKSPD
jgi:hypothetical protein